MLAKHDSVSKTKRQTYLGFDKVSRTAEKTSGKRLDHSRFRDTDQAACKKTQHMRNESANTQPLLNKRAQQATTAGALDYIITSFTQ